MDAITIVLILYLAALLGLGYWSRQETTTMAGFFLAGKKLPSWVIAFSMNATGESGWLLLGLTGMGYAVGVHALWIVVAEVLGIALAWLAFAQRFKRLSDEGNAISVPDVLVHKFGDVWHLLRICSVIIIIFMVTAYIAAQMVASGKAFSTFMGMDYRAAVMLGAAITVSYMYIGGFKAVAYTDLLQGVLMLFGLILLPVTAIAAAGGWTQMIDTIAAEDPRLLDPFGPNGQGMAGTLAIVGFLAVGLPFFAVPQLLSRFMAAKDTVEIRKATSISILVILIFDLGAVLAGMAGRALSPGLDDPETVMPFLSAELFPAPVTGLLMVIVLGAIMSTADSLLILASSAFVRDLFQKTMNLARPDAILARYGKYMTVIIAAIAVALAFVAEETVFWMVLFAWSGLAAAFGPPVIVALFDKQANVYGALAGMVSGFATDIVWVFYFRDDFYDLYEILPAFAVGIPTAFAVSRLTRNWPGAVRKNTS